MYNVDEVVEYSNCKGQIKSNHIGSNRNTIHVYLSQKCFPSPMDYIQSNTDVTCLQ